MFIIFIYILIYIIIFKKIPISLSQSVYDLKYKHIWTIIITITTFIVGILLFGRVLYEALVFIALASLLFVGGTPLIIDEEDLAYKVHMVSAYICAIATNIFVLLYNPVLLTLWIPWIIYYMCKKDWKTKKFWAEVICLLMILLILFTV